MAFENLIIDEINNAPNRTGFIVMAHAGTKYYNSFGESAEQAVNEVIKSWQLDAPQN
jgi:hypothetical protein